MFQFVLKVSLLYYGLCTMKMSDRYFQTSMPRFSFCPLLAAMPFNLHIYIISVFFENVFLIFKINIYISATVPDTASCWLVTDHQKKIR